MQRINWFRQKGKKKAKGLFARFYIDVFNMMGLMMVIVVKGGKNPSQCL